MPNNSSKSNRRRKNENFVYAASRALWATEKRSARKVGFATRIYRWLSLTSKAHKVMKGKSWYSAENKRRIYLEIFKNTCTPAYDAWCDLWETVWNFVSRLIHDTGDLLVDIANIFIILWFYFCSGMIFIGDVCADIGYWCEGRKRALLGLFATITITAVVLVVFVTSITAYEYSYYGKYLGTVKSKKEVYDTIDVLGDKLVENVGANVSLNIARDIEFKTVRGFNLKTDSEDDILNTLTYMRDFQVEACSIAVDGVQKVVVENEDVAREILQNIRDSYAGEAKGVEYTDIHFDNTVEITVATAKLGDIWNEADAEKYLKTGSIKDVTHVVEEDESYNEIADTYGVTTQQLQAANPDVDLESLTPGMVLSLSESKPIISVVSTEIATYTEQIDYGKRYIDNGAIYEGEEETRTEGTYGEEEVIASISRVNGQETSRSIISATRISDPVDAIVYRGTKPIPERIGTGTFVLPIHTYVISSHRGWRWGRMHEGVDLSANTGTKIYAADGGTVTYAGWANSYGYCVFIDHGGLWQTRYAHCSKLLVSVGDQVYQGENIALVGSTGNSTGPHLHFEVLYNGENLDPEDYVSF